MKKHLFMAMAAMISMAWMTGCSGGESKETAVDARYFRIAEDQLYGELAVALDMSRENVESYINTSLQSV